MDMFQNSAVFALLVARIGRMEKDLGHGLEARGDALLKTPSKNNSGVQVLLHYMLLWHSTGYAGKGGMFRL